MSPVQSYVTPRRLGRINETSAAENPGLLHRGDRPGAYHPVPIGAALGPGDRDVIYALRSRPESGMELVVEMEDDRIEIFMGVRGEIVGRVPSTSVRVY
jgi:hypothetical protein